MLGRVVSVQEAGLEELRDEDVLHGPVQIVLEEVEELCNADAVVIEELDDVHALAVLELLRDVGVRLEELGHRDIVVVHVFGQVLGMRVQVVLQELDDRHIHVTVAADFVAAWVCVVGRCASQELGHGHVVLSLVEELGHGHVVRSLVEELGHSDVVLGLGQELGH